MAAFAPITARATATPTGASAILYRAVNGGKRREVGAVVTIEGARVTWHAAPVPGGTAAMLDAMDAFKALLDAEHGGADNVARTMVERAIANGGAS